MELLPFHQMGAYKWQELGIPYVLAEVKAPGPEQVELAREIFQREGLSVR